eukprot:gene13550-14908_t
MNQLNPTPLTLYQSTLPVLFVDSSFLGLCHLSPAQIIQYLCFLEPQLLTLSQMLSNLLSDVNMSDSPFVNVLNPSFPSPSSLYQRHCIKRKNSNVSSEDLGKINGFILATIFYAFHKEPQNTFMTEQEKIQEERDRYSTEKQTFLQQYSDLLQTAVFSEIELHFLVNYEYVIRWIYQNIFSQGKQVNQEYVMIAGMALEGSHRIWARGGGSRGDRRVREEIYRRVSGKRKHKRTSKDKLGELLLEAAGDDSSEEQDQEEHFDDSEKAQLHISPTPSPSIAFSSSAEHRFEEPSLEIETTHRKQRRAEWDEMGSEKKSIEFSNHWKKKKMKLMVNDELEKEGEK